MSQKNLRRGLSLLVLAVVAVIMLVTVFSSFIIDYLWFHNLDYTGVFWTMRLSWAWYFALFAVLGFGMLFGNYWFALRLSRKDGKPLDVNTSIPFDLGEYGEPLKQLTDGGQKSLPWIIGAVSAGLAILAGLAMAPQWEQFLRYFNQVPFGKSDPIFGHDIAFYIFSLPVHRLFRGWFMTLVVFGFIGSALIYWIGGMFTIQERSIGFSKTVKLHLYGLVAVGLLLKAWDYRLQMYNLLYSRSGLVFGAGYTDFYVHRVALWVMLLYMLALAALTIASIFSSKDRLVWIVVAVVITLPLIAVVQGMIPGLVQQMIVKPNEMKKERPFIEYNIAMTNEAYGLSDVVVKPFPADNSITLDDLKANQETIDNIRLWDARPLLSTYQQIQAIRTYYTFYNVDVDRYEIDGTVRQVMLAPRELEREKLAAQAQTWVNTRLTFTHGYGLVMNPVNSVTTEGLPELFIKDIPPIKTVDLAVDNPAVYYGEQVPGQLNGTASQPGARVLSDEMSDYVIVRTNNKEFDYPMGDENKEVVYAGSGGVWMGSFFRRALFAWGFKDFNIFLTNATTNESRIMFRRNIRQRIEHIAPFLTLDNDPYIVLHDGRLFWIQDAYTTSRNYPYSQPFRNTALNYIRNSVKIVVDAFQGSVDFYIVDESDPLAVTYSNIFPEMFKTYAEMPDGLKAHTRYPRDLFDIQMHQYNTYHMKDPKVFYNKEDQWTIPQENYGGETITMEPYYIQMKLPDEDQQEFILMNPLTPNNKDNMIAWMAARCDGEHYGELLVFKFPKDKLVYGPSQIEARIDQDTLISQQFSLWDQRGSNIIRGNLLVIPVDDSILYVEPVYLKAETRELPELKRVIVSQSGNVAMGLNLQEALEAAFGGKLTTVEQEMVEQVPMADLGEAELGDVIQQLTNHFNAARQYLADGNWSEYGAEMDRAQDVINLLQQQYGTQ